MKTEQIKSERIKLLKRRQDAADNARKQKEAIYSVMDDVKKTRNWKTATKKIDCILSEDSPSSKRSPSSKKSPGKKSQRSVL